MKILFLFSLLFSSYFAVQEIFDCNQLVTFLVSSNSDSILALKQNFACDKITFPTNIVFNGTLDGNGNKISMISLNNPDQNSGDIALIQTSYNAKIVNLILEV